MEVTQSDDITTAPSSGSALSSEDNPYLGLRALRPAPFRGSVIDIEQSAQLPPRRANVPVACDACRQRKIKVKFTPSSSTRSSIWLIIILVRWRTTNMPRLPIKTTRMRVPGTAQGRAQAEV